MLKSIPSASSRQGSYFAQSDKVCKALFLRAESAVAVNFSPHKALEISDAPSTCFLSEIEYLMTKNLHYYLGD